VDDDAGPPLGLPLLLHRGEEVAEARRLARGERVVGLEGEEAADRALGLVLAAQRDVVEREEAGDLELLRLRVAGANERGRQRLDGLLVLLVTEEPAPALDEVLLTLRVRRSLPLLEDNLRGREHVPV